MGNKQPKPAANIISMYSSLNLSQVGIVVRAYRSKLSFQKCLLSRDDFLAVGFDVFRSHAIPLFDYLTVYNPSVLPNSPQSEFVGALEFLISCVILCSPSAVSFDEKLDVAMGLCQFRPIPEGTTSVLSEPQESVTKEQVIFLLENCALILSKIGHVTAPTYEEIVEVTTELFGDKPEYEEEHTSSYSMNAVDDHIKVVSWDNIKLCIQCNVKIVSFLGAYLDIVNVLDCIEDISEIMLELDDELQNKKTTTMFVYKDEIDDETKPDSIQFKRNRTTDTKPDADNLPAVTEGTPQTNVMNSIEEAGEEVEVDIITRNVETVSIEQHSTPTPPSRPKSTSSKRNPSTRKKKSTMHKSKMHTKPKEASGSDNDTEAPLEQGTETSSDVNPVTGGGLEKPTAIDIPTGINDHIESRNSTALLHSPARKRSSIIMQRNTQRASTLYQNNARNNKKRITNVTNLQHLDGGIGTPSKPADLAHKSIISNRRTMRSSSQAHVAELRSKLLFMAHAKADRHHRELLKTEVSDEIPVEKCLSVLLNNPNITCPDFDHVELCVVQECLNKMAIDVHAPKPVVKKEKFLEFARSIVAFNIIATAACVNKLSIFSKGSNYVYPTYLPSLFRLTYGLDHFLPHKAVLTHIATSLLVGNRNINNSLIAKANKLKRYCEFGGDYETMIAVFGSSVTKKCAPNLTQYDSPKKSPTSRAQVSSPLNQTLLNYFRNSSPVSKKRQNNAAANKNIDFNTNTTPKGETFSNVTTTTTMSASCFEEESSPESGEQYIPPQRLSCITRASWMTYVDSNRSSGVVDEILQKTFNTLLVFEYSTDEGSGEEDNSAGRKARRCEERKVTMKEDTLSIDSLEVIIKSRLGGEVLKLISELPPDLMDVAEAHVQYLVSWFTKLVDPEHTNELAWIDLHRNSEILIHNINMLDGYVRQLTEGCKI